MSEAESTPSSGRVRRAPPPLRRLAVSRVQQLSPRMRRVTLAGPDLEGMAVDLPASSVRLLLPTSGGELVIPVWNGNEFLLPDGQRPALRTFTPSMVRPGSLEVDLDVVIHGGGVASQWVESASPGDQVALSGPGRGYQVDPTANAFVLGGDESAMPAITQVVSAIPSRIPVWVHIELGQPEGRLELPERSNVEWQWHDLAPGNPPGAALVGALGAASVDQNARVWVAGEAASVQRVRRLLFEDRGFPRTQTSIRGYWKHGRRGDGDER